MAATKLLTPAQVTATAKAVIRGEYGTGAERKNLLGANYSAVQAEVNRLLKPTTSTSVPTTNAPVSAVSTAPVTYTSTAPTTSTGAQGQPPEDFYGGLVSPPFPPYMPRDAQTSGLEPMNAQNRQSAYMVINELLTSYGLGALNDFVNQLVFGENVLDANVLMGRIRQTPEYKQRFAANEDRRAKGLNTLSESEYVSMERVYLQYLRASGLPKELYDQNTDVQALLANDVSVAELASRINQGYEAVRNSDPQVVNEMRRLYGVTDSQLAGYFIDPERATPVLLRQAQAAQIAAQSTIQAGIELQQMTAEQLAAAGVTAEQAQQGFQAIRQAQDLFAATPTEQAVTQAEQIAGVFGTSGEAQQRIRSRQRARQAQFEVGGRFAGQGSTLTGLQ